MQKGITCLLLVALLGMMPPLLPAQQYQNPQRSDTEIEDLKKRVSELEKQLQTVENVEKLDLQAKLAEANAKLINTDFDTFKNELRVDNEERMRAWSHWFFGILVAIAAIGGAAIVFWLKSLIADRVEKNLNGFKESVGQVEIMKNELGELQKRHVVSVLERMYNPHGKDYPSSEEIKALREKTLLQVLNDEKDRMARRCKAAEVLAYQKKSPLLASPTLELVNSFFDSDIDFYSKSFGPKLIKFLRQVPTLEAYQGLTKILDRLLAGDLKDKDSFLTQTVFSLTDVGIKLDIGDSVPILRRAIPHLKVPQLEREDLSDLAGYFDRFNEPEGIKEILINHVRDKIPGFNEWQKYVEDRCLELLQRHDPEFVEKWRARKAKDNSTE